MSSFQICSASNAGLPLADSPPVRAMPKPILIGSAPRATNIPPLARTRVRTTAIRVRASFRLRCRVMSSSLSGHIPGTPPLGGPQTCDSGPELSRPARVFRLVLGGRIRVDDVPGLELVRPHHDLLARPAELVDAVALDLLVLDHQRAPGGPLAVLAELHLADDGVELGGPDVVG